MTPNSNMSGGTERIRLNYILYIFYLIFYSIINLIYIFYLIILINTKSKNKEIPFSVSVSVSRRALSVSNAGYIVRKGWPCNDARENPEIAQNVPMRQALIGYSPLIYHGDCCIGYGIISTCANTQLVEGEGERGGGGGAIYNALGCTRDRLLLCTKERFARYKHSNALALLVHVSVGEWTLIVIAARGNVHKIGHLATMLDVPMRYCA
jgi:hypothetical protein